MSNVSKYWVIKQRKLCFSYK